MTDIRALLYPFGFLSTLAFGMRFLVQWVQSEKQRRVVCPALFWKLSLVGNGLLLTHCLIQQHFPMALAQAINAVLAWRNLNLNSQQRVSFQTVIALLVAVSLATLSFFLFDGVWLRTPHFLWSAPVADLPVWIHVTGCIGIFCYSFRFWVQWWQAESLKESVLSKPFWWLSLSGSLLAALYFLALWDWVNLIGPVLSIVPFSRNLWLLYREDV